MRSLHRVLLERKTRRFVDQMIHKYTDILSTTRAMARRRLRAEATGVRKSPVNRDHRDHHDHGDQGERSTSSYCRTESDRGSRLSSTMFDSEQSQFEKGLRHQQQQQEEVQLHRWRMSEAPNVSECSTFSSERLTRLLEAENDGYATQENQEISSDSSAPASTQHETADDHDNSTSTELPNLESAPTSVENQSDDPSEQSECSTESPPISSGETLPRLRPMAPAHCVVPNCCDYFTSPHPHYPKEVIGKAQKLDESLQVASAPPNSSSSDATSETEGDQAVDHSNNHPNDSTRRSLGGDEFEMWDYVCPQYARRGYANEWV